MSRKTPTPLPEDWTLSFHYVANGRHLEPGTEFSIRGESGRFRFIRYVERENGDSWIDCIGGTKHVKMFRSFRPNRVRTVHRIRNMKTLDDHRREVNAKNRIKREGAS